MLDQRCLVGDLAAVDEDLCPRDGVDGEESRVLIRFALEKEANVDAFGIGEDLCVSCLPATSAEPDAVFSPNGEARDLKMIFLWI